MASRERVGVAGSGMGSKTQSGARGLSVAGSAAATRPRILHGVGHAQYSTVVLVMHPEVTARLCSADSAAGLTAREPRIGSSLDGHEVNKRIYTQPPRLGLS